MVYTPKTPISLTLREIAQRWALYNQRPVTEITSILIQAIREHDLGWVGVKSNAPVAAVTLDSAGKRQELLSADYALISRDDFAAWYGSRQPSLESWWPPEGGSASQASHQKARKNNPKGSVVNKSNAAARQARIKHAVRTLATKAVTPDSAGTAEKYARQVRAAIGVKDSVRGFGTKTIQRVAQTKFPR